MSSKLAGVMMPVQNDDDGECTNGIIHKIHTGTSLFIFISLTQLAFSCVYPLHSCFKAQGILVA